MMAILILGTGVMLLGESDLIAGTSYYVATNGNDGHPGTLAQPWRTIQKAADTMGPGDTVFIRQGVYQEQVIPQNSGIPGNTITYTVFPSESATIDGNGISLPDDEALFTVSDKSHITLTGLSIMNAGPHNNNCGILVNNSSYILIEKNYITNTQSSGIGVWGGDHVVIDGNEGELACNDGEQECITVAGTADFEVRHNHVHHGGPGSNGGEGIDAKDGASHGSVYGNVVHDMNRLGIYVDSWDKHTHHIDVFQNIVHHCQDDGFALAAEAGGLLEYVTVFNNIAYNNRWVGLTVAQWGEPVPTHPMKDITIINNTFYNNGLGGWGGGVIIDNPDVVNLIVRNNICSQNLSFQIADEIGLPATILFADHNLIDGYRGYYSEIKGDNPVEGGALFVDASGADFHLQGISPAINNGSAIEAPQVDFDGRSRPYNSLFDIGCYEYTNDGDLNLDCFLNVTDLCILQNYLAGHLMPGQDPFRAPLSGADVNNDLAVNGLDRQWMSDELAGNGH